MMKMSNKKPMMSKKMDNKKSSMLPNKMSNKVSYEDMKMKMMKKRGMM